MTQEQKPQQALMLIPSKFSQPEYLSHSLARERLTQRLDTLPQYRVALLHSPAGYGKTTAINQWLSAQDSDVSWVTLDESDNDKIRFACYLIAALNQVRQCCPQAYAAALSGEYDNLEYLFTYLFSEISHTDSHLTLVLDDYHLIDNGDIHSAMRFFIKHMPNWINVVFTSRNLPPIGIASLRIQGKLLEIEANDLAFNNDEAYEFLDSRLSFQLNRQQIDQLNQQVEGWPCALQLIANLATDANSFDRYTNELSDGHSHLIDYLNEEVWSQLPEKTQDFLMKSSILERFNEELIGIVTNTTHPQAIIEELERQGLFIVAQDSRRSWYRYHPLFLSFLQHRLHLEQAEHEEQLHQQASEEWLRQGFPHEAVQHAIAAQNRELVAQLLLAQGWQFYQQAQLRILQQCLDTLHDEQIHQSASLTLLKAWLAQSQFNYTQVEDYLKAAEAILPSHLSEPEWSTTQGKFNTLRAQVAINQGHIDDARAYAIDSLDKLPDSEPRDRITALTILGEASFCQGRLTKAKARMEEAEQLARAEGSSQTAIWALCQQSEICIAQGYLQQAYNLQDKAIQYATEKKLTELPLMEFVYRIRAQVLWEWHRLDAAEQACQNGLTILAGRDEHWSLQCRALEAKIAQARGQQERCQEKIDQIGNLLLGEEYHSDWLANAHATLLNYWDNCDDKESIEAWLSQAPPPAKATNHFAQCNIRNYARAYTSLKRTDEAIQLLNDNQLEAVRCQLITDQNRNHLCLAQAYWTSEQRELALDHLQQALTMANTTGFIASFLRLGKPLIVMLKALKQTNTLAELEQNRADRLIDLQQQQRGFSKALRISLDESLIADILQQPDLPELIKATPLTRKEWQVLSLIHAGLSNDQIAKHLEVAPSTIKTHIRSLYQKLNISQRSEAIDIASQMLRHIQGE